MQRQAPAFKTWRMACTAKNNGVLRAEVVQVYNNNAKRLGDRQREATTVETDNQENSSVHNNAGLTTRTNKHYAAKQRENVVRNFRARAMEVVYSTCAMKERRSQSVIQCRDSSQNNRK